MSLSFMPKKKAVSEASTEPKKAAQPQQPQPKAVVKAVPAGAVHVPNSSAFHRGRGDVDPFYRTWWFLKSVSKADGQIDAALSAAMQHVQVAFSDGKEMYIDRMPRRSAREPTVKFLCFHDADGGRIGGVPEPGAVRYTIAIDPAKGDAAALQQQQQDMYYQPINPKQMEYTGTLTFDMSLPVTQQGSGPGGRMRANGPANAQAQKAEPETPAAAAALKRAETARNALASVDGAGGVTSAATVKFHLIRKAHANTLQLTAPSGAVLHLTTDPPTDYSHAAVAASAKASPAFKALSTFKPAAAPAPAAAAPAAAAGAAPAAAAAPAASAAPSPAK